MLRSRSLRSRNRTLTVFGFLSMLVLMVGCANSSTTSDSGSADGGTNFFGDVNDGDRETVLIEPADGVEAEFMFSPAVFDTALIRVDSRPAGGSTIEILVKGSFPDGCSELHELDQHPVRGGQRVDLTMRRPVNAICTQVVRPYRFFFTLDRRLGPGRYVLDINDQTFPFEVD